MTVRFSNNIIVKSFDNNKLYKSKIQKIKLYDGPNNFSIFWNQLLILWNARIINDELSLKKKYDSKLLSLFSNKMINEIDTIIYKSLYMNQNIISLYNDTFQLKITDNIIIKLFKFKDIILNI